MAPRVLVHVGLQKSGSTYLQHAVAAAAPELERLGLRYPHRLRSGGDVPNHQLAVYGLLPGRYAWVTGPTADAAAAEWEWLRAEIESAEVPVLISAEVLSYLGPEDVRAVVDALGGADVDVLVTSRRLDRLMTSSWQQNLRHGVPNGLLRFLQARADDRAAFLTDVDDVRPWHVWRAFDTASTVARWAGAVGPRHVALVTSPGSPPELLWHRFAAALDVPGVSDLAPPVVARDSSNESLRWAEAEVLAGVNAQVKAEAWADAEAAALRRRLVQGFAGSDDRGSRIVLPGGWGPEVASWSAAEIERLQALEREGMRVLGDLADLVVPVEDTARGPDGPSLDELKAAAGTAVVLAAAGGSAAPPPSAPPASAAPVDPPVGGGWRGVRRARRYRRRWSTG